MEVVHPRGGGLRRRMRVEGPALLFYPRPMTHEFHTAEKDGPDFRCATLEFDGGEHNPLARALPPLIVLPLSRLEGIQQSLSLLFGETERVRCGQRVLADRLFEVVLIQLLRWLLDHPEEGGVQPGLIAGLSEPRLARALVAVHDAPGESWTLEAMAERAGMSRSSFALLFKEVIGQTPAGYLADWRLSLAQKFLREGRPVKLIAHELGYATASALARRFSSKLGVAPRRWISREREQDRGLAS